MDNFKLHQQLAKDTITLGHYPLCRLLLAKDGNYPWLILVPQVDQITEFHHLSPAQQAQFLVESNEISKFLVDELQADKINIAAIGNMVPQLHIHHVARYKTDPSWPKPIWGQLPAIERSEQETARLIKVITSALHADFIPVA